MSAPDNEIVVIDDDEGDLELARLAFAECATPPAVKTFLDGESAYAYLRTAHGDAMRRVVLLDLNMPGMDGRELLEKLRKDRELGRLVVIVFTTSDSKADVERSYAGHANAFVTKPSGLDRYRTIACRICDFWFETATLPEP